MKFIYLDEWELKALANKTKSSKRIPLNPQPKIDNGNMWHWKDCQWMDLGLGLPQSGIEDYCPYHLGDVVGVLNASDSNGDVLGYVRICGIRAEQLQKITDESAQNEGCQGVFSGTGESCGSGWEVAPTEEFASCWNATIAKVYGNPREWGWNANPWVFAVELEEASKEQAEARDSDGCKYCKDNKRWAFRCDVRSLRDGGETQDIPVPVFYCPYCGRTLRSRA